MEIKNHRAMKQEAADALSQASYDPRKLVLIHSGVTVGVALLLTVLNFVFKRQIDMNGGLAGLGMRTVLGTIQSVLQFASSVLMPFWQIGFVYTTLRLARRKTADPRSLTEGFRHIFPVLTLMVLESVVISGVGFLCAYIASIIFMLTPSAVSLTEVLKPMMTGSVLNPAVLDEAGLKLIMGDMVPFLVIFGVLFVAAMIPIFYRFRMAQFLLMDASKPRGFGALVGSCRMMRGNCMDLFRVDLSFWWYYGLHLLILAIGHCDLWLPLLGVELPFDKDVSFFLFYILYAVLQMGLLLWAKAQVDTTYGVVYDRLLKEPPKPKKEKQAPTKMPWD